VASGSGGGVSGGGSWAAVWKRPAGRRTSSWQGRGASALGEEVVARRGARGRRRGGGPREKGQRPSGRRLRSTGRRGGALADDGGALVEVGRALLKYDGVVGGAAAVGDNGDARWENLAA
jgi:hypothetical protein